MEDGNIQQPSTFFLPGVSHTETLDIRLSPEDSGFELKSRGPDNGVILSIEASEYDALRELTLTF